MNKNYLYFRDDTLYPSIVFMFIDLICPKSVKMSTKTVPSSNTVVLRYSTSRKTSPCDKNKS